MACAIAVIDADGPAPSVERIARAAGVTRQVLYRQFDDRDDLDAAVADAVAAQLLEHLLHHVDVTAAPEVALRTVLEAYLDHVDAHRSRYWFVRSREAAAGPSAAVSRLREAIVAVAAGAARELAETAGVEPEIPLDEVLAVGMVGLADAVVSRWLASPDPAPRDEMVDGVVTLVLAGAAAVLPIGGPTTTSHRIS